MTTSTAPMKPVKVTVSQVQNFVGPRLTRITWTANVELTDGTSCPCGHDQHRTIKTAAECGKRLWRRLVAAAAA